MLTWVLLGAAGFVAGAVNAIAGGGTLISFPALLGTGMDARVANATNTVAIWPGSVSSIVAYQRYLVEEKRRAFLLAWPSLLGGLAGSWLLFHTSEQSFRAVVPWLIVLACVLLAVQTPVARWVARRGAGAQAARVPASLYLVQFLISVYGGYFGAGIGILMLAAMAIFVPTSLQAANGLKILFGCVINGVSAVYFAAIGAVRLPEAGVMALTSVAGGWVGAHVALRLPPRVMRNVVVAYGLAIAAKLFLDRR